MEVPTHIAIIMDGNRRWAKKNNLDTPSGHKKGAETLEKITKYCNKIGVKYLTCYTFSTENWKRSELEVKAIMLLMQKYIERFMGDEDMQNVKLKIVGNMETIPSSLRESFEKLEKKTENNTGLQLNLAFNYGGRAEIVNACKNIASKVKDGILNIDDITEDTFKDYLYTKDIPDPDLVIRTSGEVRTSNFLPYQTTYSEFLFLDKYWPEFEEADIDAAIENLNHRQIRKGS